MTKDKVHEDKKKSKEVSKDEEIAQLKAQVEEYKNDYLRARADFDNFRKRKEKEMSEVRERAIVDFVLDLLPSIDNFEMSLKMTDNKEMFIRGVEMIHKNLTETLKSNHVKDFIPEIGEEFDPYKHDPVLVEDKNAEPGRVIGVLKKGYLHKENVIRPARVQVVQASEKEDSKKDEGLENKEESQKEFISES